MAVDNPFDRLGEAAQTAGESAGGFFSGIARFLEQVTGDAFTAAVFGALLLFALSLVKGAATARNSLLYARAIMGIGLAGMLALAGLVILPAAWHSYSLRSTMVGDEYKAIVLKGLTGQTADEAAISTFISEVGGKGEVYYWYFLVFLVLASVGFMLSFILRLLPKGTPSGQ